MVRQLRVVAFIVAMTLVVCLKTASVVGAHGGEAHAAEAVRPLPEYGVIGLVVGIIVAAMSYILRNRGNRGLSHLLDEPLRQDSR